MDQIEKEIQTLEQANKLIAQFSKCYEVLEQVNDALISCKLTANFPTMDLKDFTIMLGRVQATVIQTRHVMKGVTLGKSFT